MLSHLIAGGPAASFGSAIWDSSAGDCGDRNWDLVYAEQELHTVSSLSKSVFLPEGQQDKSIFAFVLKTCPALPHWLPHCNRNLSYRMCPHLVPQAKTYITFRHWKTTQMRRQEYQPSLMRLQQSWI